MVLNANALREGLTGQLGPIHLESNQSACASYAQEPRNVASMPVINMMSWRSPFGPYEHVTVWVFEGDHVVVRDI
jgi:hypothetical protein